jgi:hypothetical protein
MDKSCLKPDCTVAQTGICLLNNDPNTCPERTIIGMDKPVDNINTIDTALETPPTQSRFPSSLALSPEDAQVLMCKNYCYLIGILGAPDAGKTAALVSLYLLLAGNKLNGFEFRDSRSIRALDDISRGARRWNDGKTPEQMTAHTELADERSPGFMHLRLFQQSTTETVDFLLPDLPGEWSTSLIDLNRIDRMGFLKSADCIWIMVDGRQLTQPTTRQHALHRTKILMQRVASFLEGNIPPFTLVITWLDAGTPSEQTIHALKAEANALGVTLNIREIASFSDTGLQPGTGISDLISSVLKAPNMPPAFWQDSLENKTGRAYMRFRNHGGQA